jgi:CO/xanthine dehydrogenase FAD-binding subunit
MLQHVYVPNDLDEAIACLADGPGTALLAGGTLLMPVVNNEVTELRSLVSTRRLRLDGISIDRSRATIGAATTLADVGRDARLSFLNPVVESIASPPIRNLATVGGNLFAPQPYGDFAVALLALDASVQIAGVDGHRNAAVGEVLRRGVGANEIVTAIEFVIPAEGTWLYTKAMRRKLNSASIVTVAAVIETDENMVTSARVALGGVGPRPLRAVSVEAALIGRPLETDAVTSAAALAVSDVQPFSDAYASAWYRERVLPVHIRRAILGE